MRVYEYNKQWQKLLTPEIVTMLSQIHEYKGKQDLYIETKNDRKTDMTHPKTTEMRNFQSYFNTNLKASRHAGNRRCRAFHRSPCDRESRNRDLSIRRPF